MPEHLQSRFSRPCERDAISVVRPEFRAAVRLVVNGFKRQQLPSSFGESSGMMKGFPSTRQLPSATAEFGNKS
jgi:hypothetical protein